MTTFDKYGFDAGKNKYDIDGLADVKDRLAALEKKTAKFTENGCPFSIGYIFISMTKSSPKSIWPETEWSIVTPGRVLLSCNQSDPNAVVNIKDFKGDTFETYPVGGGKTGGRWQTSITLNDYNLPFHLHKLPGELKFHHHDIVFPQATYPNPSGNPQSGTEYSDAYGLPTDTRVYTEASGPISATRYYTLRVDTQSQEIGWALRNVYDTSGEFDDSHIVGVSTAHGTLKTSNNSQPHHPITTTNMTVPATVTIEKGYYYNGDFWTDVSHTVKISRQTGIYYWDENSKTYYTYDAANGKYVVTPIPYVEPTSDALDAMNTYENISTSNGIGRSINFANFQPYIAVYMWQRIK